MVKGEDADGACTSASRLTALRVKRKRDSIRPVVELEADMVQQAPILSTEMRLHTTQEGVSTASMSSSRPSQDRSCEQRS